MSDTDMELLTRYSRQHGEDAFAELVRRHLGLVYCAALRQVRSPQLAEEVAQSVFIDLARNAETLKFNTILTAWLYQVAHRTAIDVVRREASRQLREQIATQMNAMSATAADWTNIEPLLDEAMHALDDTDRAAVLLRYFENKSLREVGATLGTSENAAQKRLGRAVERLREFFSKRGVTVGTSGLIVIISANAVQAAPVGLALTISTAAVLATPGIVTTATATTAKTIGMTTLQKTLVAATLLAGVGAGIHESHQAATLRSRIQQLQQDRVPLTEQIEQLNRERDDATRQLAALRAENERAGRSNAELLRQRGEVAALKREADESAAAAKAAWSDVQQTLMSIPPVRTFVATAQTTTSWDQAILTGGWKTPSGKRAILLVTLAPLDGGRQVMIRPKVLEFTEEAGQRLGLAQFNSDGQRAAKVHTVPLEQSETILAAAKNFEGVEISDAPSVSSLNGRQAQIQAVRTRTMPSGESFSTGPVIDFIPTVAPDGQSVQMVIAGYFNYLVPQPHIQWP